ncbi:AI-2E family transporter [Synechococcales cyanobacterium C]|uniref:AI-2E family transporter n=1 Tax=Petrachloros mirabilis ULC683 TaxID=2781853 RepID=A0A8K2A981_9CYAN|nr:AI-2E family transporter [Petrachloros mirabilis]NCJ07885.1 AI-2E family transporter [Petrachloros mirabilis ULC683]
MNLGQWIGFVALLVSVYVIWQVRQLLLLLFTAVVLATVLNHLVQWLEQRPMKRLWAVVSTISGLLITLLVFFWLIVPPFVDQFQELIDLLPTGWEQFQEGLVWIEEQILEPYFPNIPDVNSLLEQFQPQMSDFLGRSVDFFSASVEAALSFLLVVVLSLMLLVNPQPYQDVFVRLFPSFYRRRIREVLARCESALGSWVVGALIEMVFISVLSALGLWILGVKLVLAHALLAGVLNFIPNIGPTLSVIFPMAVALPDSPWKAVAVLVFYIVIQQIESYWLTPTVMAKQVSLLPAITLTVQIFFASVFGFLGLLIALPLAVVAKIWLEEVLLKDILDPWQPSEDG